MSEYVGICANIRKSARMTFVLHLPFEIPCLKGPQIVFLKGKKNDFFIVAESI